MSAPTSQRKRTSAPTRNGSGEGAVPAVSTPKAKLPHWAPWSVLGAVAAVLAGILAATGFSVVGWILGTAAIAGVIVYGLTWAVEGRRKATDRAVTMVVTSAFLLALTPLFSVLYTVISHGVARLDLEFFTYSQEGIIGSGGGVYHALVGTLVITGLATMISVPVGILAAVYLVEYGRGKLRRALTFLVDVMVGIPSIVAGLFAYALFALVFGPGITMGFMGALALSVLMIPIVVRSSEEMLRVVPRDLREAALALGVPKWRVVVKVVLPTAAAGMASGVTLAIARIVGETAPLLVTVGIVAGTNWNPFNGEMATLSVFAYNEYQNPGVPQQPSFDQAWSAALLLICIVLVLNIVGRLIARMFSPKTRR